MIKEILPAIFLIPVPLPRNPMKALNAYLIKGQPRHLLIDTGFHQAECREALLAGLKEADVKLSEIDYFITHVHGDHSGLVCELAAQESKIYCSQIDAQILQATMSSAYWQEMDALFGRHGFPVTRSQEAGNRVQGYISGGDMNFTFLVEGYELKIGQYRLSCVMTPGHSPGHVCLYEPVHKLLFAGDHILADISPNITVWREMEDSLGQYLQSLDMVKKMDVDLVLTGHRSLINDHQARILELQAHHQLRLEEILIILINGPLNAYQVASHMKWDLSYDFWEQVPPFQKWFATGEAIAHLEHLVQIKKLTKLEQAECILYERTD